MIYDYIISGAGAAGMSLLYRMMRDPFFAEKTILVADKFPKNTNDHTWCFWENENGVFENIVHHQWEQVYFRSEHFSQLLSLAPYRYKMIRSIDLYKLVMAEAAKHKQVSFKYGSVSVVDSDAETAFIEIDDVRYHGQYVFNSILLQPYTVPRGKHHLLQHFKGWVVETEKPVFDPSKATFMDFTVSQQHGTTFMYVLPSTPTRALVEYTLFTKTLLQQAEYDLALSHYIKHDLGIENYQVAEVEFGIIPMTNINFKKQQGRVINMGTAGGQTKPSSGYTFTFIQKQCDEIVVFLKQSKPLSNGSFAEKKFFWFDSVLLNVLANERLQGDRVFAYLFKKNKPSKIFKFLDNETGLVEDIGIISSLPILPFLKAGLQEIIR